MAGERDRLFQPTLDETEMETRVDRTVTSTRLGIA